MVFSGRMSTQESDASAYDPAVICCIAVILLLIALIASAGPAWRAARVDPNVALREE